MKIYYKAFLILVLVTILMPANGQNIGINTTGTKPDSSAGLDISFNNKGLLIPRVALTGTNVATPVSLPATSLLVYNTATVGGTNAVSPGFYYWNGSQWVRFTTATFTDTDDQTLSLKNDTLFIADGNHVVLKDFVYDGDSSTTNELQTLTKSNDTLFLSNGGFAVLPTVVVNTDDQTLGTNGDTLFIEDGNYVLLTDKVYDGDSSVTNELQTLTKSGSLITLSNGGGSFTDAVYDGDSSSINELQTLTKSNDTIFLSNGGFVVLPAATIDTDDQSLSTNGDTLFIEDGNYILLTDKVYDGDSSVTNELQTLTKSGSLITLSNGGGSFTDAVYDGDSSSINELQTLTKSNDTIFLSNGGFVVLPNEGWKLSGNAGTNHNINFLGTTDNQGLVFKTNNMERMRINTNGNVSIGTTNNTARLYNWLPSSDNTTNFGFYNYFDGTDAGTTYGIRNNNYGSGNGTKYGIYNAVNSEGTGTKYGTYNYAQLNSSSNANVYGTYNRAFSYGTGRHYGTFNNLNVYGSTASNYNYAAWNDIQVVTPSNTSTIYGEYTHVDYSAGTRYGEYKELASHASYTSTMYGDYNLLEGQGNGDIYGYYNQFINIGSGAKYGLRNLFVNSAGIKYGVCNIFGTGTAAGDIYGTYTTIGNTGTGSHYGIYANVPGGTNDYAALFNAGNVVANEVGGDYDFRIESDNNTNMFFLDASQDRIGIGRSLPSYDLHLQNNSAGKPGTNTWTVASDKRLKQNINPFRDGLSTLRSINPVYYKYNGKANIFDEKYYVGVIAQELEEVAPYMIGTFEAGDSAFKETYKSVDNGAMTYITINAVKELDERQKELQDKVRNITDFGVSTLDSGVHFIPYGLFFKHNINSAPVVTVTPVGSTARLAVLNQSESGFTVHIINGNKVTLNWIAIAKMKPLGDESYYNDGDRIHKLNTAGRME